VNNPTLADVTFNVDGRKFHAHRIALLASSDAFRAMFNGGYREKASTGGVRQVCFIPFAASQLPGHYFISCT
jgi:hypothetical protein